jgi:hypothetical protein
MAAILLLALFIVQSNDVREAWELGRTHELARLDAFNKNYQLAGSDAVDYAEVLTEFRRCVLLVREHAQRGDFGYTPIDVERDVKPLHGQIAFVVQARLNPLHVFVSPPRYELFISTGRMSKPLAAKPLKRDGVYGLNAPKASGPLIGVRVEGAFLRSDVEDAEAPVLTLADEKANVIWQAPLDLSRYR